MKLSLSWIYRHLLGANWQDLDVEQLVYRLSTQVAEVDSFIRWQPEWQNFYFAQVTQQDSQALQLRVAGFDAIVTLDARQDAAVGQYYLLHSLEQKQWRWADCKDFLLDKNDLLSAFTLNAQEWENQGWRKNLPAYDWILEVDNKALTHRPDLWGHRGFAREIAALDDLTLLPESQCYDALSTQFASTTLDQKIITGQMQAGDFAIELRDTKACKMFNAAYLKLPDIIPACRPNLAFPLLSVAQRPINSWVDLTNYVMQDWAQPLHVYDADAVEERKLVIRMAQPGEPLVLLDNSELKLTENDLVVASGKGSMCLAGVMGDLQHSSNKNTTNILLESATFDATTVRRASARHKVRTQSSARFEKTLDTQRSLTAIYRLLKLAQQEEIPYALVGDVYQIGIEDPVIDIQLEHEFVVKQLGIPLACQTIEKILTALGFAVDYNDALASYRIRVPAWRASKDITIKQDLVEEIIRILGYDLLQPILPKFTRDIFELNEITRPGRLKDLLAYGLQFEEQVNYPFYDQYFCTQLGYVYHNPVTLLNPVSENNSHLIQSLMPGLLKNVQQNLFLGQRLQQFEVGRVWQKVDSGKAVKEEKLLAGIVWDTAGRYDFYQGKAVLDQLILGMQNASVEWRPYTSQACPMWLDQALAAELWLEDSLLGYAGMLTQPVLRFIHGDLNTKAQAFIFELSEPALVKACAWQQIKFKALPKLQPNFLDFSLLVDTSWTVAKLEALLIESLPLATEIKLVDRFSKPEWNGNQSITLRVALQPQEDSLLKTDLDAMVQQVTTTCNNLGITVR